MNAVWSSGNMLKQFSIIGSSFHFLKRGVENCKNDNVHFTQDQEALFKEELEKTQQIVDALEKRLSNLQKVAQKVKRMLRIIFFATTAISLSFQIQRETRYSYPATYIGKNENDSKSKVVILLCSALAAGAVGFFAVYKSKLHFSTH